MGEGNESELDSVEWIDESNDAAYAGYCIKLIEQEWNDWKQLLKEADDRVATRVEVASESPWEQDLKFAAEDELLMGAIEYVYQQFQRLTQAARQYVEAIVLVLRHDKLLIQTGWTLDRGMLEATLLACWLVDSAVSSEMRLARFLSLPISIFEGAIDALSRFPDDSGQLSGMRTGYAEILEQYESSPVTLIHATDRKGRRLDKYGKVLLGRSTASVNHNVSQLAKEYIPHSQYLYSVLSGAAHSQPWSLVGINPDNAVEGLNSIVLPLSLASEAYMRSLATYMGIDPRPFLARNKRRRIGLSIRTRQANAAAGR